MDLLKISDEQEGMYLKNDGWVPIRDIERDDLLALIRSVADNDDIKIEECNDSRPIKDPIAKTIYDQVYKVLHDLDENRATYLAGINQEFNELERKYGIAQES